MVCVKEVQGLGNIRYELYVDDRDSVHSLKIEAIRSIVLSSLQKQNLM